MGGLLGIVPTLNRISIIEKITEIVSVINRSSKPERSLIIVP